MPVVPMDQSVNTASCATGRYPEQLAGCRFGKVNREIRDDEEMIFLGDVAGLLVVFGDIRVFIAEIHLDDFFHVLIELGEPFFELLRLRPDSPVDQI